MIYDEPMVTIRCTQRLLARLRVSASREAPPSTTRLGDWYANLTHVGRRQVIIAVNERTFVPAIFPAAPIGGLASRLREEVALLLEELGVSAVDIGNEIAAMEDVVYAKTLNRHAIGMMNEFAFDLPFHLEENPSLRRAALELAHRPCGPLRKREVFNDLAAKGIFGVTRETDPRLQ